VITPVVFAPGEYVSPEDVGYAWSLILGVGYLGIVCGALIISLLVKARSLSKAHAREEEEMLDLAARPLSSGPRRVVRGRVECEDGKDVAIEIDIDQVVTDRSSKNGRWHTWDETDRTTRKTPFYLAREDGETIYVDPPDDVLVVDELETKYPIKAPRTRIRFADVRRGETFFVYGDLDRGPHPRAQSAYRDGDGWILRSPRQRMLLATDAIRERYRARVSYLNLVGGFLALMFVLAHVLITRPFLEAALFGTHTSGNVIDHRTWVTTHKGNQTTHYSLTAQTPDGLVLTQEVSRRLFDAMVPTQPDQDAATIPVLESGHSPSSSFIGLEPTLLGFWLFGGVMVSITAAIFTVMGYRTRVPWYDRPKLNEHGGSGYWIEPRPQNPVE
jgi:hypothetical protein